MLEAALSDAKAERDEWRDQAKRLAMALPAPDQKPEQSVQAGPEPLAQNPKGFWKRVFG